jgi:hypothetical protein
MSKRNIFSYFLTIKDLIKFDFAFVPIFSTVLIVFYNSYDFKNHVRNDFPDRENLYDEDLLPYFLRS